MNILMIAQNDPAGMAIAFTNAINRHTNHSCRLITTETRYNFDYQKDLHVPDLNGDDWDEVRQLLRDADIIHFHMLADEHLKLGPVDIKEYITGKKIIHHHHGHPTFRSDPEQFRRKYRRLKRNAIVSTPDLLKLLPEATWVPNIVPVDDPLYKPLPTGDHDHYPILIGQSPTRTDLKNTDDLRGVVKKLQANGFREKIELAILEWTPHRKCLEAKRQCHIIFDHMQGYYGVSSLESLAQGKPVIAGLDQWNIKHIKSFTGANSLPWVIARSAQELEQQLGILVNHREIRITTGRQARAFMEEYWNEKRVLEILFNVYEASTTH